MKHRPSLARGGSPRQADRRARPVASPPQADRLAGPGILAAIRGLDTRELAAIFAGGAIGAGARTGLVELAPTRPGSWPWTTFAVNVVGSLLLGYFVTRLQERLPVTAYRRPLLGTGLCGALTTFSTFQLDLLRLLDSDQVALALLYLAGSLAAGFLGLLIGTAIVRRARLTW